MTNILALTKVFIKNGIFPSNSKDSNKQSKKDRSLLITLIAFTIYLLVFFIPLTYLLIKFVKETRFGDVLIAIALPLAASISILFGVFSITSVFYFSKDSECLLPLPIKSGELLISKFLAALVPQYFMIFMLVFPLILASGIGMEYGVMFYIYAILGFVLIPIIPSILTSIFIMLLNKCFHLNKRKDLFMYIMVGLIFVFSFAYGFLISNLFDIDNEAMVSLMSGNKEDILRITSYIFIFFNPIRYALLNSNKFIGVASFITFIGINILGLVILYLLADKLYIKGLLIDKGNKKQKDKEKKNDYKVSKSPVLITLLNREWTNVKRTPIFMLNIVLISLLFPLIFCVIDFVSMGKIPFEIDFTNSGIYLISFALIFLISDLGGSSASSSSISRDGKSMIYLKSLPISFKKIIDSKVYFASLIDCIAILLVQIPLFISFKMPWYYILLINIPFVFLILISNYIGVLLDLYKPNLTWNDESEPIKQNKGSFINLLLTLVLSGILFFIGYMLMKTKINVILTFILFTSVLVVCYILLVLYVKKNQVKLFNKVG